MAAREVGAPAGPSAAAGTTIVAPATPRGVSAVAVVRLSGPETYPLLEQLTDAPRVGWEPRRAVLRLIRDPETGRELDQALVLPFRGPESYTGEDLVELHLHGNPVVVSRLVEVLTGIGAEMADAGAFTRRAILNGKMGLPEAEALAELIEAVSPLGAAQALGRLRGELRRWAETTRADVLAVLAQLEAQVDFPDEPIEPEVGAELIRRIRDLAGRMEAQADAARRARVWTEGARVVLAGAPNVGKSTLLNRLLGAERAIVSPWAGTTRDYLEAGTTIAGVPIRLMDTAGIRSVAGEEIEAEGVRRSAEAVREADLVVHVRAPDARPDAVLDELMAEVPARRLTVWNKGDLGGPPASAGPVDLVVSATDDPDMTSLLEAIAGRLAPPREDPVVGNLRQERQCRTASAHLEAAAAQVEAGYPPEIAVEEVRAGTGALARLLGEVEAEQVLDVVFASFCIGK